MAEYTFDISLSLGISVEAKDENEARSKLTEQISEYFANPHTPIAKDEAVLIDVDEAVLVDVNE